MVNKVLSFLLLIVPVILELIEKKRKEKESPAAFVRRQQEAELEQYETIQKDDGAKLGRIRQARLAIIRERSRRLRKSDESKQRASGVHNEGTRVRIDTRDDVSMSTPVRSDDD